MYVGDVYLNGERIGGTDYGYLGFEIDLSKLLRYGSENVIAVRASTSNAMDSRWYTGGGLYRDVHLVTTDPQLYLVRHPLKITTTANKDIHVQAEVFNGTKENAVTLQVELLDASGKSVYSKTQSLPFLRQMKTNELKWETISLENAHLWNIDDPYLYTAKVTLYNKEGKAVDCISNKFGVRTFEIGPDYGLKLNGKKVILKGIANHHSLGALGAAAYPRAMEKRLKLLKEFGFNHVRTSHNPYSESFLNLCDSLGIIVVDELYDKWLQQFTGGRKPWMELWPYDLPEWVKRDRNHASVAFWSLGNELQTYSTLPFGDWGVTPYKMMKTVLERYDDTRKVTVAMHPRGRNWQTDSLPCDLAMVTDIQAYNYRYMYFPTDGQKFPWMTFYQSEANLTMMGPNYFGMNLDKVIGLAYWGMIDYLGESRGWPLKGWNDGVFDLSLQPKPKAYLLRSMFKPEEPVCHMGIIDSKSGKSEWNGIVFSNDGMSDHWNRTPGERLSLFVYTNGDRVELVENGKTIATKDNTLNPDTRNQIRFDNIVYEPGYLEAKAYKNGKLVASHRIETTGNATALTLVPDQEVWKADGLDLMHIRINAVDSKGRKVPYANEKLTFQVEGDARIVAVDNGDMVSDEVHVSNERSLYHGSALVILRAGKTAGKITLTVKGDGYKTQKLTLKTMP
jgi:beta-galactosidase